MGNYPVRVGGFLMLDAEKFVCIDKICAIETYRNTTAIYTVDGAAVQTQFTTQAIVDATEKAEPPARLSDKYHFAAKDVYEDVGKFAAIKVLYNDPSLTIRDAERYVEYYFEGK